MSTRSSTTYRALARAIMVVALPASAFAQDQQPTRQLLAVIPDSGFSLLSDRAGTYRAEDTNSLAVGGHFALALCTDRSVCGTIPRVQPSKPGDRSLLLDFSHPVQGTGAVNRGLVGSANANFGVFWGQDTTRRATFNGRTSWAIRSLLDLPIDSTISSERVELRFFMDGAQHILQFGPWVAGQFQPRQGPFDGRGTIRASVVRTALDRWVVRSGPDAIGRLWDNRDPAQPRDLGLYSFTFQVVFIGR